MSQHDYVIANASGATVRADLNSLFQAMLSQNSGTSAPSTTAAGMFWLDTTGGAPYTLKIRDAGNNHWLTVASITDPGSDGNLSMAAIEGSAVLSTGESGTAKFLRVDGDGTCSWAIPAGFTQGTALNTSGTTAYGFTSLPSSIKELTLSMDQVSTATGGFDIQLGDATTGGYITSGYLGGSGNEGTGSAIGSYTAGLRVIIGGSHQITGIVKVTHLRNYDYILTAVTGTTASSEYFVISWSRVTLAAVMDRIQLQTASGNFDNGYINIHYS